nr:MAG TPA: hypothetical protein [Caudoviricetes sp.]
MYIWIIALLFATVNTLCEKIFCDNLQNVVLWM